MSGSGASLTGQGLDWLFPASRSFASYPGWSLEQSHEVIRSSWALSCFGTVFGEVVWG